MEQGIRVDPDPAPDGSDPGHVLIPEIHFAHARESHVLEKMLALSGLCFRFDGPFIGRREPIPKPE
jgi:hypothetical protein